MHSYPSTILVWYCQFDISPVDGAFDVGHLNYIKVKNLFSLWVHLEILGVQKVWVQIKVGFPSPGTCVQKRAD